MNNNLMVDIKFKILIDEFNDLLQGHITQLPNSPLIPMIRDHIEYYNNRWSEGLYYDNHKYTLKNQPYKPLHDDRYGLDTIYGVIGEFYAMIIFELQGHDIIHATTYEDQVTNQIDFFIHQPSWKSTIPIQAKRTSFDTIYISKIMDHWLKTKSTRLCIIDSTSIFCADTLYVKKAILYLQDDDNPPTTVTTNILYNTITTKFPTQSHFASRMPL